MHWKERSRAAVLGSSLKRVGGKPSISYTDKILANLMKTLPHESVGYICINRLLYKWTMHGKSPSITMDPNTLPKLKSIDRFDDAN